MCHKKDNRLKVKNENYRDWNVLKTLTSKKVKKKLHELCRRNVLKTEPPRKFSKHVLKGVLPQTKFYNPYIFAT